MIVAKCAMIFSSEISLQQCKFEGDSEIGIKALQTSDMFSSSFGHLVRDTLILVTSLQSFCLSHIVSLESKTFFSFVSLDWICSVKYRSFCFYEFFSFLIIFSGLVLFLTKKKKDSLTCSLIDTIHVQIVQVIGLATYYNYLKKKKS